MLERTAMCEVTELKKGKKYKLVPPDGGWGYMICVSTIIMNTTIQAVFPSFGLIFNDFMVELNMGSTSIAMLNGLNGVFVAVAGYTTGPLSKVLSWRKLSILGTLLMSGSCVGTYFANSKFTFFLFQALQCAGTGYLVNISCTMINEYFLHKRLLSMTLTQTVPALLSILAPMFFKWSLNEYGFRGTLLLMIGLMMQNFVAAVMMQPVKWHMKKVPISESEEEENLLINKTVELKMDEKDHGVVVLKETKMVKTNQDSENQISEYESPEALDKPKGIIQKISDALDLPLFKSIVVVSATFGTAFAIFAEITFTLMLPQALFFRRWTESDVAWALTLMCIGDVAAKFLLIVLNTCMMKLGFRMLYMIGLFISVVARIGMLWSKKHMTTLIYLTLMGVSRCLLNTLMPLVLSEAVSQAQFANAMGMYMLMYGALGLVVGPVIGAIRDMTNSYATSFCIITSLYAIVFIFWSIEMCYMRNQRKEQRKKLKPIRNVKAK